MLYPFSCAPPMARIRCRFPASPSVPHRFPIGPVGVGTRGERAELQLASPLPHYYMRGTETRGTEKADLCGASFVSLPHRFPVNDGADTLARALRWRLAVGADHALVAQPAAGVEPCDAGSNVGRTQVLRPHRFQRVAAVPAPVAVLGLDE